MKKITVGDIAPDFSLKNQEGKELVLSELLKKSKVVVFFYPKDNTPGCTKEACSFRDAYHELRELGAEVIGISSDGRASHHNFAKKHNLQFDLLSDTTGEVRKAFGIKNSLFVIPGRRTFLIDQDQKIIGDFDALMAPQAHVVEMRKLLNK